MKRLKILLWKSFLATGLAALAFIIFVLVEVNSNERLHEGENSTVSNEGKILGEEEEADLSQMFKSQNYHSPQITFGGDAIAISSGQESLSPEILDVRSELLTTKKEQNVKFLLTWKTNKPSISSIEYMKGGQAEGRVISESGYGYIHSAQIYPLSFSTSYSYIVRAKDRWGNEAESEKLTFYTGAPNVSILDLLGGAFKDMFGWANR